MKVYGTPLSGHGHRPVAMLKLLNLEFETITIDMAGGEHKKPEFLALNPLGQVPVFIDGDVVLRDSTAILTYLALKHDPQRKWLPEDPYLAAQVQQWLTTSVRDIVEGPFQCRLHKLANAPFDYDKALAKTKKLYGELFEPHLAKNNWLVGDHPTIADIANYGYIAASPEGEIDLEPYPNLVAWLRRLEAIDGFHIMPKAKDILGK